jgi:hypothetical protein
MRTQFRLLSVCRWSFDCQPVLADPEDLSIMRIMDEIYLEDPCMGTRCLKMLLKRDHGSLKSPNPTKSGAPTSRMCRCPAETRISVP